MGPAISVISPCFNEAESIQEFLLQLKKVLDSIGKTYEVIIVNDGSTDDSLNRISKVAWPQLRTLNFPVNLGHQAALDAGHRSATGELVITMDSDLQHPPELIPALIDKIESSDADVVYATRNKRAEDSYFKRFTAKRYYGLMRSLTQIPIEDSAADFRVINRRVLSTINSLPAGGKVFRLLIPSLGFRGTTLEYEASPRYAGQTKYSLTRMIGLLVTSVVSFSVRPLWISIQLGLVFALLAIANLAYTLAVFLSGETVPGWASTSAAILILFSINFFVLGVIGLYVGEINRTLKNDVMAEHIINRTLHD